MSKPIQDRIYRSRLTIKYRTNIDGVPVAQTLPLRLLVLGNMKSKKNEDGSTLPQAARFDNRQIVSIKRGTRIDKVIEEMDITFPIPPDTTGRRRDLVEHTAAVTGSFTSDREKNLVLSGYFAETDDEGKCAIVGTVSYGTTVYDNRPIKLGGTLEAVGTVNFGTATLKADDATLKGECLVPVAKGTVENATPSEFTFDKTGKGAVKLAGKGKLEHPAGTAWVEGDLEIPDALKGTISTDAQREKGHLVLDPDQTVKLKWVNGSSKQTYSPTIAGKIPLKNTADLKVGTPSITLTATDGATKEVPITEDFKVEAPTLATKGASDKVELAINSSSVRIRQASTGKMLTGTMTGKLTGQNDNSYKVGKQPIGGQLNVVVDGKTFDIQVTGTVDIVVSAEKWELDSASASDWTLSGEIPIAVTSTKSVTQLLAIAGNKTLKAAKQGVYKAKVRDNATLKLKNVDGHPPYEVDGIVAGALTCSLKQKLDLKSGASTTAQLNVNFTGDNGGPVCKLEGTLPVEVAKPMVTVSLSGRLRGEALRGLAAPDALQPEDVCADVRKTLSEGDSELTSTVQIDESGNLSVTVEGKCPARRSLRIRSLDSFTPDSVARHVPEIRRLRIMAALLHGLNSLINLKPEVRGAIAKLVVAAKTNAHPLVVQNELAARYPAFWIGDQELQSVNRLPSTTADQAKVWFEQAYLDGETVVARAANIKGTPTLPSSGSGSTDEENEQQPNALVMKSQAVGGLKFHEHDIDKCVHDRDRLANSLAILLMNDNAIWSATPDVVGSIDNVLARIHDRVQDYLSFILNNEDFRLLERNWRQVAELCDEVTTDEVIIDLLDVGARELADELESHAGDIFTSTLFKRVYVEEYDRYGGKPFGAMIGLYRFDSSDDDIKMLTTLSEIANAAHCPFISGVDPTFFGEDVKKWSDLDKIADIEAHMNLPKFGKWNVLRDSGEAPYLGLVLPGYLLRKPWSADDDRLGNRVCRYDELKGRDPDDAYLWGNSAILFARNLVRSFEGSGWCQYIRGVKGGGLIQGLTTHSIKRHGKEELQSPVQYEIADYRELQFAKAGLIPLVHCKESSDATFFSTQSLKKPRDFRNELDTQNAYLVTNLAYTFSITRIAHYVKRMMRDYIGSTADGAYIQNILQLWLGDYITTTVNPDDLTLRYYPFKAVSVDVQPKPGPLGWYKAVISILPHIQFEGMDVELRLEAALGGK